MMSLLAPTPHRVRAYNPNKGGPAQPHPRSGLHRLLRQTNHQPRKAQTPLQNLWGGEFALK